MFGMNKLSKMLLAGVVMMSLMLISVSVADAASWSVESHGYCTDGPHGISSLRWSGYPSSSYGETYGWLWKWSGSSWYLRVTAYDDAHRRHRSCRSVYCNRV